MLLHEVRSDGAWKFVLDLHPRVTVLAGLGPDRRDRMAALLESALLGRPGGFDAWLEIEGQRLDVGEWAAVVAGGGLERVDPVVRAAEVPRAGEPDGQAPAADGEPPALADVEPPVLADVEGDVARADAELRAARAALAAATARRQEAEDAERNEPAARVGAEPLVPSRVNELRSAANAARGRAAVLDQRRGLLVERVEQARSELDRLHSATPRPAGTDMLGAVDEALREAEAERWAAAFDVGAAGLLERLAALEERRRRLRAVTAPAWLLESARVALEEARLEVARAEQATRPVHLSAADVAELEAAHREVTEAEDRADRPIIGPMARRRLAEAREVEQQLLRRLGLPTYGSYLLRGAGESDQLLATERLERARKALADAEAVWDELQAGGDGIEQAALESDEAEFRSDASRLLGESLAPDEDLASVGRRIERLAASVTPTRDKSDRLARLLAEAGVDSGGDPVAAARAWVASQDGEGSGDEGATGGRQTALVPLIAGLEHEISELDRHHGGLLRQAADLDQEAARLRSEQPRPGPVPADPQSEEPVDGEPVVEARRDEGAARLRLEQAEESASIAAARLVEARSRHAGRTGDAFRQPESAEPAASDAEIYLLARLAAVRSVGRLGSVPLVLVEPLVGQDPQLLTRSLDLLARMSELIQIIYLSDEPEVLAWADGLGPDWAAIRRFGRPARHPGA